MEMLERRGMIGQQCIRGYIQDGLAFWLDAEDFDGNKWIDRIGGVEYTRNGTVTYENYGVHIKSRGYLASEESIDIPIFNGTLEVCCKVISPVGAYPTILSFFKRTNFGLGFHASDIYGFSVGANPYQGIFPMNVSMYDLRCISIAFDTNISTPKATIVRNIIALQNTKSHSSYSLDTASTNIIGTRTPGSASYSFNDCYIYSIRYYNKRLTTEEMINNQQIDNIRFDLGL